VEAKDGMQGASHSPLDFHCNSSSAAADLMSRSLAVVVVVVVGIAADKTTDIDVEEVD
jgi:hypothetical protein